MSTVERVNSGLTHFPMGRGNYFRRAGLPFVRLILSAVLLGGAVSQVVAQTSGNAVIAFSPAGVSLPRTDGPFTLGTRIRIGSKPVTVTALGAQDGGRWLASSIQVGLWSSNGSTLLRTATVPKSAVAENGGYRYLEISPITLSANTDYLIGALGGSGLAAFVDEPASFSSTDANITLVGSTYNTGGSLSAPLTVDGGTLPRWAMANFKVASVPGVETGPTNSITGLAATSVSLAGALTNSGGTTVTNVGFYLNTNSPATNGVKYSAPGTSFALGSFSNTITGLAPGTSYTYRAFAANSVGTGFGANEYSFTTPSPFPFTYTNNGTDVTITGYTGTGGAVVIPSTIEGKPVTSIAGGAFLGLSSITGITIPSGLTTIGGSAFKDCGNLTSITIPESVTSLGAFAFSGCDGLTSITLGSSVANIGESTFSGCVSLSSIIIPNSVNSIGKQAFYNCIGLTAITIPSSVITVGEEAFRNCYALESVAIGSGVTTIGASAFINCRKLTSLTIPNNVTSLGNGAFTGCYGLTSLTIGSGVTSIASSTFLGCTSLTTITIPNSVTSLGLFAFSGCTSLTTITIGSGVTSIGEKAFSGCTSLTTITIPNNVTSMGNLVFFQCYGLTSVEFASGVTIIAPGTFSSCTSLTSVTIPNTVTTIGTQAFRDCSSLTSITIPSSVAIINSDAFKGCTNLATVNFERTSPPTIGSNVFTNIKPSAIGYYPVGAAGWNTVTITGLNLVSMPSGITGTSFTVYWAAVVGAEYTIEVSTTPLFGGGDIVRTVNATASETSKLITGLSANTNYWYRVTASSATMSSTASPVPVTTGSPDLPIPAAPVLSGLPASMVYQQKIVLAGAVSALQRTMSTPTAIPDYNGAGINQTVTIAGLTAGTNYQVNLGINVSALGAGVLGDLKIYLQHTLVSEGVTMVDQTRILLDRVGVAAGDTTGSLATGLNVIMSDSGAFNVQGPRTDSATPLTGTWQPASLLGGSSFGLSTMGTKGDGSFNWNGDWALVVADLAYGGAMQLDSWSMQFSDLSGAGTSGGTAGLEYELVAPTSGLAKASISKNELEALSGTGRFDVRARYRAVDGVAQVSEWTTKTIGLTKKEQIISFPVLGTRSLAPKFMSGASSDAGLPLTYSSSNTETATIDGASGQITPLAEGTTTISVAQAGDENFSAATTVSQLLTIASTPLNPAWGLSQLYSQDSTNRAVAGVTKGANTYAYTKIEYAEASAAAQIRTVPISFGGTQVANLTQTNEVAPGVIRYSSPSNPAFFTGYSSATNAVPNGNYVFVGKNSSSENVTNAVVNWSNSTNDYPVQAPQIGGTWVGQSLRISNPAIADTISWVAWTNTPVVGSTNSIRVEVTGSFGGGSLTSGPSSATEKFVTNLPANSTSLAIPAVTLLTNQVYSVKVAFVTTTGGAARSTETQLRMVTGPMNPPANPAIAGVLLGNVNVVPGTSAVGTLAAFLDEDVGDTETLSLPTFTFPDANDNNLFVLDGRTIRLAGGTFDYGRQPLYSILVRATDSYGLYSETTYTISVQGTQSITFADLNTKTFGDAPFNLTATAPAGTVIYTSSNTGVATISGSTVTIQGAGFADITANQAGGGAYLAATPVVKRLTVNQAASTIRVTGETSFTYTGSGQGPDTSTTTGSTGAVTYVYAGPNNGGTSYGPTNIKPAAAGSYTVTAAVANDANFNGATSSPNTAFTITSASSTITGLAATDSKTYGAGDYTLSVTKGASSNGLIFASSAPGVATINSTTGLVSIKGAGTATLTVNQAADANYNAATQVSQTLTVNPAASTITVTGLTSFTYTGSGQGPDTSTTTGSTGAVTYMYAGTGYGPTNIKPTAAGSYTVTAAVASSANYGGATSSPTAFTIGIQTLTIRADDQSRGYGAANPGLTGSVVSGAVLGENFVVTASTTATASSAPGSYTIVPDVTGATLSNYTVSKINGSLTVSSAPFAGEDTLTAAPAPSSSTKYSFAQLLLNDSTYAGTLSITGVAAIPGVTQGTVSTKGSWVVYVPKAGATAGATDSFNYTLSNGTSTTTGTVTISLVSLDMTISVALASPPTVANGYKATFLVMPGLVFEAYGSDTVGGTYTKIGTTWTSASSGKLEVTDSAAIGAPSRFYKLKWLPGGAVSPISF